MITLFRCDDRLIHGQCMTQIVKIYNIKNIIVVDNFTASNKVLKKIFESAVPKPIKASVYSVEDAVEVIDAAATSDEETLVLMKSPQVMYELTKKLTVTPTEFNVATVARKAGKKEATTYAFLSDEEIEALKSLEEKGIHIWFRLIPDKPITEWADIKNNL